MHVALLCWGASLAALVLCFWALNVAQRFGLRLPRQITRVQPPTKFPKVAVILPIRGLDDDTPANVRALLAQDYPSYRLIFVVESELDPATAYLSQVAMDDSRVELVVAGLSMNRGQKIHNQLAAIERTSADETILAFMDADARPAAGWLQALVTPLTYGQHIGATTGYRCYVPVTEHPANRLLSILNAKVAALLGPYRRNFAWGGSMAIRRDDFFGLGVHEAWQGALSDDFILSYCVKNLKRRKIHFVPQCLVASEANFNWASLFEFAVRQYRITRVCAPRIWVTAVFGACLYLGTFIFSVYEIFQSIVRWSPVAPYHLAGGLFVLGSLYSLSALRGYLLVRGMCKLLPEHANAFRPSMMMATAGMPFCFLVNLLALMGSACGRTIVWRGIAYRLVSRTQTLVQRPTITPESGEADPATRAQQMAESR